jgi:AcrR family transcriptional regulator
MTNITKEFDKKEAILNATLELISKHGFHSSPMSEVAKQANVAAGTIYHYFKSKDELICALYVSLKERTTTQLLKNDDASKITGIGFGRFTFKIFITLPKTLKNFTS